MDKHQVNESNPLAFAPMNQPYTILFRIVNDGLAMVCPQQTQDGILTPSGPSIEMLDLHKVGHKRYLINRVHS